MENSMKQKISIKLAAIVMVLAMLIPMSAMFSQKSHAALSLDGTWRKIGVVTLTKKKTGYATISFQSNGAAMDVQFRTPNNKVIWSESRSITPPKSHMGIYNVSRKYKFGKDHSTYVIYAKLSNAKYIGACQIKANSNVKVTNYG